ncbi:uncharacterized protein B0H18DRAFT_1128975 [Fomitopsis serialis]|uniref:uncharacterized protein n=1 Tax=Fomitopsis serialis TaxID=139415 RepID=UPI0020079DB2|nr:uncharacterized protein B0H18DRAFT_1128975 [Neoantrodia serialis]KAH9911263.1 hypothetical protein B0H18DRAFT_1128975 [Neoantrodia serialis]
MEAAITELLDTAQRYIFAPKAGEAMHGLARDANSAEDLTKLVHAISLTALMAGLKELARPAVASEYGVAHALTKYWEVMAPPGREHEEVLVAVVAGAEMQPPIPAATRPANEPPIPAATRPANEPPAVAQNHLSSQDALSPETVLDGIYTRQIEMGPIIADQMRVSAQQLRQVEERLQVATLRDKATYHAQQINLAVLPELLEPGLLGRKHMPNDMMAEGLAWLERLATACTR